MGDRADASDRQPDRAAAPHRPPRDERDPLVGSAGQRRKEVCEARTTVGTVAAAGTRPGTFPALFAVAALPLPLPRSALETAVEALERGKFVGGEVQPAEPPPYRARALSQRSKATARIRIRPITTCCV